MKQTIFLLVLLMTLMSCQKSPSNLELPALISDNMVMQQSSEVNIWGTATPGHKISVVASWDEKASSKSGKDGKWVVILPTPAAGGPYTMTISGKDTSIVIYEILSGEVWFCSGQSNMEMPLEGWPPVDTIQNSAVTIQSSFIPEIRLFNVQRKMSDEPLEDCIGRWESCEPSSVRQFSATAYFFGRKLYQELHVPIGLIESAWGGTPAESWISSSALESAGEFTDVIQSIKESAPLQHEYQEWLESHEQLVTGPSGIDQWKNLDFNDENVPSVDYDDTNWPVMNLPGQFERVTGEFDGAVWFRKNVEIPSGFRGKDLVLSLGPIDDMDRTYFNGMLVGATEESGMWQVNRDYEILDNIVKEGVNTISVRVLDTQGGGGIYGAPGSMELSVKGARQKPLDIGGEWKYQPVAELAGNRFYIFDITKNEYASHKRPISLGPYTPTTLYNGMVNPVVNYRIKGAIWYQGEANVGRAEQYKKIFPLMIQNWREAWRIKDFPFYYVQIAPYVYSHVDSTESALLREAQKKALELTGTGMAVTLDITTVMNIHPPYKKEVGERLAFLALNNDYGINVPCVGPVYKSMTIDGSTIKVQFDNIEQGLVARNGRLKEFEIAGKDGKYVIASAGIVNNEVVVYSPLVPEPVAVRYCWRNGTEASLFNSAGLPAWQFSTK